MPPTRRALRQLAVTPELRPASEAADASPLHGGIAASAALSKALASLAATERNDNPSVTKGVLRSSQTIFDFLRGASSSSAGTTTTTASSLNGSTRAAASALKGFVHPGDRSHLWNALAAAVAVWMTSQQKSQAAQESSSTASKKVQPSAVHAGKKKAATKVVTSTGSFTPLTVPMTVQVRAIDANDVAEVIRRALAILHRHSGKTAVGGAVSSSSSMEGVEAIVRTLVVGTGDVPASVRCLLVVLPAASSTKALKGQDGWKDTVRRLLSARHSGCDVLVAGSDAAQIASVGSVDAPTKTLNASDKSAAAGAGSNGKTARLTVHTMAIDGISKASALLQAMQSAKGRTVFHVATKASAEFYLALLSSLAVDVAPQPTVIANSSSPSASGPPRLPIESSEYTVFSFGPDYPVWSHAEAKPTTFIHVDPPASLATWLTFLNILSHGDASSAAGAATTIIMMLPPTPFHGATSTAAANPSQALQPRVLAGAVCQWMTAHAKDFGFVSRPSSSTAAGTATPSSIATASANGGVELWFEKLPTPPKATYVVMNDAIETRVAKVFTLSELAYHAYKGLMTVWSHAQPATIWGGDNLRAVDVDAQAAQFGLSEAPLLDLRTKDTKYRDKEDYLKEAKKLQRRVKRSRAEAEKDDEPLVPPDAE